MSKCRKFTGITDTETELGSKSWTDATYHFTDIWPQKLPYKELPTENSNSDI